jgi:hypothetical protein
MWLKIRINSGSAKETGTEEFGSAGLENRIRMDFFPGDW